MYCIQKAWQEHEAKLRGWLRRRLLEPIDAEDRLQEVFLRALRQGRAFCDIVNAHARLFKVARNALTDRLRVARAEVELPDDLTRETDERRAVGTLDQCLPRVLSELPPEDREALVLCDLECLPQKEYARRKGITLPAAKSRVQRARVRLKVHMSQACRVSFDEAGAVAGLVPRLPVD